jgi:transposase InsO family protein
MKEPRNPSSAQAWARFRFAVVGPLLSSPPQRGELAEEIKRLSKKTWRHPITGDPRRFGFSTIEAWYYTARRHPSDPVGALRRQLRSDYGKCSLNAELTKALRKQYAAYKEWSYQLHTENLASLVKQKPEYGPMCSYSTIWRYMKNHGMVKKKRKKKGRQPRVEVEWDDREVRCFESPYVGSLWHLDFHHCSRKVLLPNAEWYTPIALGVLDDCCRVACHLQWYLTETTEDLVHGFSQAIEKWGLPAALMADNGGAMKAAEFLRGLERLGIHLDLIAPYSPYQNAKQEAFWDPLEARLIAMLKHKKDLTLDFLNMATQAWVDIDYNRKYHSEIAASPLDRYRTGTSVLRSSPSSEQLRLAFRLDDRRTQRHSDGTVSIEGVRFEIPAHFRHVHRLTVRYARWNLNLVHLVDPRTDTLLCRIYPVDKEANSDGRRRRLPSGTGDAAPAAASAGDSPPDEIPPLLREILDRYSQSGRPPAYIPKPFPGAIPEAPDATPPNRKDKPA